MTQNNERELFLKIKDAICMAIYSDDGLDGVDGENLIKEIDKYLSPISQNEQQPKQIPDGWISVKDRFPERIEGMKILCFGNGYIFEAEYDDGFWTNIGGEVFTHWMPLPAVPTNTEVGND